jgi:hypothetical protein
MDRILNQDPPEMSWPEDQNPVQQFTRNVPTTRSHIAFACPRRRLDDLDVFGAEDSVEGQDVLGVPVADHEPQRVHPHAKVHHQVPRLLSHPRTRRVGRRVGDVLSSAFFLRLRCGWILVDQAVEDAYASEPSLVKIVGATVEVGSGGRRSCAR